MTDKQIEKEYKDAYQIFMASVRGTPYHIQLAVLTEEPEILVKETFLDYTHNFDKSEVCTKTKEYTPPEYLKLAQRVQSNIVEKREKVHDRDLDNTFYNVVQNELFKPLLTGDFATIVKTLEDALPEKVTYPCVPVEKTVRISFNYVHDKDDDYRNPDCKFLGRFDVNRILKEVPEDKLWTTTNEFSTVCDLYRSNRFYYIIIKNFVNDMYCTVKIKKDNFVRDKMYEIVKGTDCKDIKLILCKLLGYERRMEKWPKSIL